MRAFLELVDRLVRSPREDVACRWLVHHVHSMPDPERGFALGVLAGAIHLPPVTPRRLRTLVLERLDPVLFEMCRETVGTVTGAVALSWPARKPGSPVPGLADLVHLAATGTWSEGVLTDLLDRMGPRERQGLLAVLAARWRPPVPAALLRTALARAGDRRPAEIDELWSADEAPYLALLAWLDGQGPRPSPPDTVPWWPMVPTCRLDRRAMTACDPASWCVEWKWDGLRVQVATQSSERRIRSARGEDLGTRWDGVVGSVAIDAILDGVLQTDGAVARIRLVDILSDASRDLRDLPLSVRRRRLHHLCSAGSLGNMLVPAALDFADSAELRALHSVSRGAGRSGLVLKRLDRAYRPDDADWYSWDADPLVVDAVLLHVARLRPGAVTCTFGVWRGDERVPVASVPLASGDPIRQALEGRMRVIGRSGPVRVLSPDLVCTLEYDRVCAAPARKAGLVLHNPRVRRVCDTIPATGVGTLDQIERWLG